VVFDLDIGVKLALIRFTIITFGFDIVTNVYILHLGRCYEISPAFDDAKEE
jgi:hypothetical protein